MMTDLFGARTKADIKAARRRKVQLGRRRKERRLNAECAWRKLRARVHGQAIARSRALSKVWPDPPAEYVNWSEPRRLRFWHGMLNAYHARNQWYRDDDERIQREIAQADRAYARRCAGIEDDYKRALTHG